MIYYAVVLLVVGLAAGLLNLAEGSLMMIQMSWVLFLMGVVLIAMDLIRLRTLPVKASGVDCQTASPRG